MNLVKETKEIFEIKDARAERFRDKLFLAIQALDLIASPKRPDGTYNRSREACEVLARETLVKINK